MNQMLKGIRLGWDKLTRIVDKRADSYWNHLQKNQIFGKSFINSRLLEMLGIEESGQDSLLAVSEAEKTAGRGHGASSGRGRADL